MANFIWTQTTRHISFRGRLDVSVYPRQLINHFKNHPEISNKLHLFVNMHKTCMEYGLDVFNFIPMTFIFNADSPEFAKDVVHFFRFFKGLELYNYLRRKKAEMGAKMSKHFYRKSLISERTVSEPMTFQNKQTMRELSRLRTRSRSIRKKMRNSFRNESLQAPRPRLLEQDTKLNVSETLGRSPTQTVPDERFGAVDGRKWEDLYCLQNFYFEILENAMRLNPRKRRSKGEAGKSKLNLFSSSRLRQMCFKMKKNIFKRILKELNYPNRTADTNIGELDKEISLYLKMTESIRKRQKTVTKGRNRELVKKPEKASETQDDEKPAETERAPEKKSPRGAPEEDKHTDAQGQSGIEEAPVKSANPPEKPETGPKPKSKSNTRGSAPKRAKQGGRLATDRRDKRGPSPLDGNGNDDWVDPKDENMRRLVRTLFAKTQRPVQIPTKNSKLMSYYSTHLAESFNQNKNLWLMKVTQYNRGFGIELFSNLREFCQHLHNFKWGYQEKLEDIITEKKVFESKPSLKTEEIAEENEEDEMVSAETGQVTSAAKKDAERQPKAAKKAPKSESNRRAGRPDEHPQVEHADQEQQVRDPEIHRKAPFVPKQKVRHPLLHPGDAHHQAVPVPGHVHPALGVRLRSRRHAQVRPLDQYRPAEVLAEL